MSYKLGMIVSNVCAQETIEKIKEEFERNKRSVEGLFREDYCLYLKKTMNPYMDAQMMQDEMFLEVSKYNDYASIGMWKSYNLSIEAVEEGAKKLNSSFQMTDSHADMYMRSKRKYENNAEVWIDLIKFMKTDCNIQKVGIFHYMTNDLTVNEKFDRMKRVECKLEELTMEYLLKIEMNVIVFFV